MTAVINGTTITEDHTIKYTANPKRPHSNAHTRYSVYMVATTITEYMELAEKKYAKADLRHDEAHGFIGIFNSDGEQINLPEEPTETADAVDADADADTADE